MYRYEKTNSILTFTREAKSANKRAMMLFESMAFYDVEVSACKLSLVFSYALSQVRLLSYAACTTSTANMLSLVKSGVIRKLVNVANRGTCGPIWLYPPEPLPDPRCMLWPLDVHEKWLPCHQHPLLNYFQSLSSYVDAWHRDRSGRGRGGISDPYVECAAGFSRRTHDNPTSYHHTLF